MISIIAAVSKNNVIGKQNSLPWNIPEDLKIFKSLTESNVVIMGRKTYESIGKPLPNRTNIVITSSEYENLITVKTFKESIEKAKEFKKEIYIIGGESVYKKALEIADTMYLSHLKKDFEGDVFFPEYNKKEWKIIEEKDYKDFTWKKYIRL